MNTARNGAAREHRVAANLARRGWRQIMRAAGSKGSADLAMVHAEHGLALIQVGSEHKTLGPAERARFLADALDAGALAILATAVPRRGYTYWHVTLGQPHTWTEWKP